MVKIRSQLRWVFDLLTELNIEHNYQDWSETKWRPNGLRYHTSGGSKEYTGGRLRISEINLILLLLILTTLGTLGVMLEIF